MSPAVAATLGFAAGLALEAALRRISIEASLRAAGSDDMKFSLKWPNDVLAGQKKLAGILLEAEAVADDRLAVVVGIGTNVVAAPEGTPTPATSLRALGVDVGAEELFSELSDAWAEFRGVWDDGRGFGEIRRQWLERAAGLGQAGRHPQRRHDAWKGMFDEHRRDRLPDGPHRATASGSRSRPAMSISASAASAGQPDGASG